MNKSLLFLAVGYLALAQASSAQEATVAPKKKPTAESAMKAAQAAVKKPPKAAPVVRADRLDLETTVVTGNRELPKVLYIVPWKKADLGELPAQPFNTLLDEVLQPVDREVFKREVKYFQAVTAGVGSGAAAPQTGSPASRTTAQ